MSTVKLGEICTIVSGGTPSRAKPEYWQNGTIPWIKIGDINKKYVDVADEFITEAGLNDSSAKMLSIGTILYTIFATLGEVGILNIDACTNQAIAGITINDSKIVLPDYLYYYLKSKKNFANGIGRGVAQNNINMSILRSFEVPLPCFKEQRAIVDILEKVCTLIDFRKRELQSLDNLIKARFVEMFGDQSQFPTQPLALNVEEMFIGPFGSALKNEFFVDEDNAYCMVYEQKHAIQKTMDVPTRFVDKTKYDELKRFTVRGGDIIVSCRGTIGEIYSVPEDAPIGIMHPSIMKIRLKKERYRNLFFVMMLEQYMRDSIKRANGSGVKMAVTATELGKEGFVVPPIEKQIEYELIVKQIDKSKFVVQQALDKAQLLFDSLMQKYFG